MGVRARVAQGIAMLILVGLVANPNIRRTFQNTDRTEPTLTFRLGVQNRVPTRRVRHCEEDTKPERQYIVYELWNKGVEKGIWRRKG